MSVWQTKRLRNTSDLIIPIDCDDLEGVSDLVKIMEVEIWKRSRDTNCTRALNGECSIQQTASSLLRLVSWLQPAGDEETKEEEDEVAEKGEEEEEEEEEEEAWEWNLVLILYNWDVLVAKDARAFQWISTLLPSNVSVIFATDCDPPQDQLGLLLKSFISNEKTEQVRHIRSCGNGDLNDPSRSIVNQIAANHVEEITKRLKSLPHFEIFPYLEDTLLLLTLTPFSILQQIFTRLIREALPHQ